MAEFIVLCQKHTDFDNRYFKIVDSLERARQLKAEYEKVGFDVDIVESAGYRY